ncbi:hypothetical protein [Dehalobacter sp. TeCB1]|uniref:hypothetical protein n=1 Tax=Dehalobacter sp. TeCB1 TaxID=1843715 RepID=UPI00083A4F8D|nr:hypothetical protein [Dehalobacter sp. TeCB1]OCZ54292.1 hypothetical protein A7D23_05860 [Dehalobacter sp. TeCB1]
MDKLIKLLAPFGVMGIVFIVALTSAMAAGLAGAAAFTAAMAALGPGGMIGGVITLGVVGIVAKLAVDYGYDGIAIVVVKEQLKTKSKDILWSEISKKKFVSKDLKLKIKDYIDRA